MISRLLRFSHCIGHFLRPSRDVPSVRLQNYKNQLGRRSFAMSAPQDEPMADPSPATAPAATSQLPPSDEPASENKTSSKQLLAQNPTDPSAPPLSKNALKKLRKAQAWADGKDDRKVKKKEKRHERKARKRDHREALLASGVALSDIYPSKPPSILVPVTLVLDCDFEKYMNDKERISLASQVTRSYSMNKSALWRAHLWVAGWGGRLLERFEGPLDRQHAQWKGVGFCKGDFAEAALEAGKRMEEKGGEMIEPLKRSAQEGVHWERDLKDPIPLPDPEPELDQKYRDVVYLTSDSPYTITRLEPNKSYIVGGLVDKNREKGLCYRRARERGIRTARLPIGQYMAMSSRKVLATNHVIEIMLKWLEFEDWGKAFEAVIPKRKGGVLKGQETTREEEAEEEDEEAEAEGEQAEEVAADEPGPVETQPRPEVTSKAEAPQETAEIKAEGS